MTTKRRIELSLRDSLSSRYFLESPLGYFVGIDPSNPYATVTFEEDGISIKGWGREEERVAYEDVTDVEAPKATTKELPKVMAWAEGYFMYSEVVVVCGDRRVTVPCFVSEGGKSFAFAWVGIRDAILRGQGT